MDVDKLGAPDENDNTYDTESKEVETEKVDLDKEVSQEDKNTTDSQELTNKDVDSDSLGAEENTSTNETDAEENQLAEVDVDSENTEIMTSGDIPPSTIEGGLGGDSVIEEEDPNIAKEVPEAENGTTASLDELNEILNEVDRMDESIQVPEMPHTIYPGERLSGEVITDAKIKKPEYSSPISKDFMEVIIQFAKISAKIKETHNYVYNQQEVLCDTLREEEELTSKYVSEHEELPE